MITKENIKANREMYFIQVLAENDVDDDAIQKALERLREKKWWIGYSGVTMKFQRGGVVFPITIDFNKNVFVDNYPTLTERK